MQANWDEKYLIPVEYFSHLNMGRKLSSSGETSHLDEMLHLI